MFELKDLPSYDTLAAFGAAYGNPDVDGLHAWLLWASATNEMLSAFEGNLARHGGLSQSQFFVLLLLKRNPDGLSVGALAQGVSVTSQTMTRIIDRMEGAGLCQRSPDPQDRRAWLAERGTVRQRTWEVAWVSTAFLCAGLLGQIYGSTVVIGLSAACAGLVLCLWAGIEHVYSLLAASVLFVAGIGISVPSLITRVADLAPAPVRGLAVALYTFVLFVGASIGPWLAQSTAHWSWAVTLSLLAGAAWPAGFVCLHGPNRCCAPSMSGKSE